MANIQDRHHGSDLEILQMMFSLIIRIKCRLRVLIKHPLANSVKPDQIGAV